MHGYTLQTPTTHKAKHTNKGKCATKNNGELQEQKICAFAALFWSVTLQTAVYTWYSQHETQTPHSHDMQYRAEQCHTHTRAMHTCIWYTHTEHLSEYKSKTWKCLTEWDSQLPLPALPHRQTGKFLKANSSQTQTIIQNAQGNKHTAAAELRCVSKKIWGNIKERHVCANLHSFYYSAEIIIFAHQTHKLEWRKTSKEKILRPDVWNRIFG